MILPVSVIIPTRNCREELARHLENMRETTGTVAEVIGVDGSSTDGTESLLQEFCENHACGHFIGYPPGLYEGWNAAVERASQPYIYFSTVGDTAHEGSLAKLHAMMESHALDVVISPPGMIGDDGEMTPHRHKWPIHFMTDAMESGSCRTLTREQTVMSMTSYIPGTILGSSASNLYRSGFLKAHPFPTGYGHAGDTAWGIENCLEARVGILAETVADFQLGWKFTESDARLQREAYKKLVALAEGVLSGADCEGSQYLHGWFMGLSDNKLGLWDWLASQAELAQKHHGAIEKIGELSAELERRLLERIYRTFKGLLSGSSMEGGKV
jgi:glycosyltransferase involved in cell wall biosynthesis